MSFFKFWMQIFNAEGMKDFYRVFVANCSNDIIIIIC